MKRALVVAIALLVGATVLAQETRPARAKAGISPKRSEPSDPRRPFVGTWRLLSSTEVLPDGTKRPYGFGVHANGYLMYDATGHMCAQVVNKDRPTWKDPDHPTPEEIKTAFDGFGGYCGTYTVDEKTTTLTHLPEVPFDPNLVGQPKPRTYKFEDGQLVYTGTEPYEGGGETHRTMVWEKIR
jgi:hypothetical protein